MNKQITVTDLTKCADEKIHQPGSIQPHGVLFTIIEADLTIAQASLSAFEVFGLALVDRAVQCARKTPEAVLCDDVWFPE